MQPYFALKREGEYPWSNGEFFIHNSVKKISRPSVNVRLPSHPLTHANLFSLVVCSSIGTNAVTRQGSIKNNKIEQTAQRCTLLLFLSEDETLLVPPFFLRTCLLIIFVANCNVVVVHLLSTSFGLAYARV